MRTPRYGHRNRVRNGDKQWRHQQPVLGPDAIFSPAFFEWGNRYAIATTGATISGRGTRSRTTVPARPGKSSPYGERVLDRSIRRRRPNRGAVKSAVPIRTVPAIRVGGMSVDYLGGVLAGVAWAST